MRNNLQNDVKVENSRESSSKLDLSGSVSTTASMGKVNVKFMRRLLPFTKALCGEEQMVWLSPMVRPTYGKQFYKTWHYFLSCKDLWVGWSSMKTGQPVSVNGEMIKFTQEPSCALNALCLFALTGAKVTLYISDVDSDHPLNQGVNREFYIKPPTNASYAGLVQRILAEVWSVDANGNPLLDAGTLIEGPQFWDDSRDTNVASGNISWETFTDLSSYAVSEAQAANGFDYTNVPIDKADAQIFYGFHDLSSEKDYVCCFAFRFSSWGRWYANILRALGYGFSLSNNANKTLLPLVGVYSAYWHTFGLNQFQNFETTSAGRLKSFWDTHDAFDPWLDESMYRVFRSFILTELGAMWVTEQSDYVAAHLPQPVIGAKPEGYSGLIDTQGQSVPIQVSNQTQDRRTNEPNVVLPDGHAFITQVNHGALDSKLLMRLYKVTNRNTALGRKIADLMKSAGLGFYAMYCKVNYIGETSIALNVDKVVSQSDTFNPVTEDGALLGDYAGRGIGYKPNDKKLYHYTEDEGFWFCLDAITCDSGYSQGVDQTLGNITRAKQFTPDYDGFGLVIHNKDLILGQEYSCSKSFESFALAQGVSGLNSDNSVQSAAVYPFGFAPIYSEYKVGRSILNGAFAQPSERNAYLAFILDKLLFTNQIVVQQATEGSVSKSYKIGLSLPAAEIPVAGTAWRYLSRFFWLSNLSRIFAYSGAQLPSIWSLFKKYASNFEYVYRVKDNYTLVSDLWFKAWSACLPIEETWGTLDEDKKELEYYERT